MYESQQDDFTIDLEYDDFMRCPDELIFIIHDLTRHKLLCGTEENPHD